MALANMHSVGADGKGSRLWSPTREWKLHSVHFSRTGFSSQRVADAKSLLIILDSGDSKEHIKQELSKFSNKIEPELVGNVLQGLSNPQAALLLFDWAGSLPGFNHNVFTFNCILSVLVKARRLKEAYRMLNQGICTPDRISYSTLINGFAKARDFDQAYSLLYEMENHGLASHPAAHNSIIKGLCAAGRIGDAISHYKEMVKKCAPTVVTYTTMIDALAKSGQMMEASQVLNEMRCRACPPNTVTYNALINGFCKMGDVDSAANVLNEMIRDSCTPDVFTYSTIIDGLCKANKQQYAYEIMEDMIKAGCKPNFVTYNTLMDGFCKSGRLMESFKVAVMMLQSKCNVSIITCNLLTDMFCKAGKLEYAYELLQMMSDNGWIPDVYTYNSVISGASKAGKMNEACHVLEQIIAGGHTPDSNTFNIIIAGLCRAMEIDRAYDVYEMSRGYSWNPDVVTYSSLIDGLCKAGRFEYAENILDDVGSSCCVLDSVAYFIIISRFHKVGRLKKVLQVFTGRIQDGFSEPNSVIYRIIMEVFNGDTGSTGSSSSSSDSSYRCIVDGLCRGDCLEEAYKLFMLMMEKGCIATDATYEVIVEAECKMGNVDEAMALVRAMEKQGCHTQRVVEILQRHNAELAPLLAAS